MRVVADASSEATNGDVVLTSTSAATVTSVGGWEYRAPASIDSVSPATGHYGTLLTIAGTNLLMEGSTVSDVRLASVTVSTIVSFSSIEIVVIAAHSDTAGPGSVHILMDTGAESTSDSQLFS